MALLALAWFVVCLPVEAKVIRYMDASGGIHFTDNRMNVPSDARILEEGAGGLVNAIPGQEGGVLDAELGASLFAAKCGECHVASRVAPQGKVSLFDTIISPVTRMPVSEEELISSLRRAASGAYSDMDSVEITEAELKEIARYLLRSH